MTPSKLSKKGLAGGMELHPLPRLPIAFDEERHLYTWEPTQRTMSHSVTEILRAGKDPKALEIIEKTRVFWERRGKTVHFAVLEQFLRDKMPVEQVIAEHEEFADWLWPALTHPFWEFFTPIAIEYPMVDIRRGIGGSLDVLGYDGLTERLCLIDVKTTGRSRRTYSTTRQLGGYLSLLIDSQAVVVDEICTFWAHHGAAELAQYDDKGRKLSYRESPTPDDALQAWEHAYSLWEALQVPL